MELFVETLLRMEPQNMVYVDLNSIMHSNAKYLAEWNDRLGNKNSAFYYRTTADNLLEAIGAVCNVKLIIILAIFYIGICSKG